MLMYLVIAVLISIAILFVKTHSVWKKRGIAQLAPWEIFQDVFLYFIGRESVPSLINKVHRKFKDRRYFGIYQFGSPVLVIRDPELINDFSLKHFNHFTDRPNSGSAKDDIFWQSVLLFLKGERWKKMRNALTPTFTGSKMRSMFAIMDKTSQQYVNYYLDQSRELINVDIKDSIGRLAADFAMSFTYGLEIDSLRNRNNEFFINLRKTTDFRSNLGTLKGIFNAIFPELYKYFDMKKMSPAVFDFFKQLTFKQIRDRENNKIRRPDVINLLMETRSQYENEESKGNAKGIELSDDDIAVQVLAFNFGAYEPISTLLGFCLYHLALIPDIQNQLQMEIDQVLETNEQLSLEKVSSMKYLDMVVSEFLRMYPMVFYADRICTKSFTIEPKDENELPVEVAEGDSVLLSIFGLHYDPRYFPHPHRFDPERFSDENRRNRNNYVYIPFGVGQRHCIGNRLAIMQTKTILVRLLSKLEVVVTDQTAIPIRFDGDQSGITSSGIRLGYKKRIK